MSPLPHSEPHCSSYYAATRNIESIYSPLAGDVRSDVCVIGGGFTGVSTALALAERGYSVTLLEQNRIGWGASGRNGGQVIGGFSGDSRLSSHWGGKYDDMIFEIGYRGHDIIAQRVQKYGIECDLKSGYIDVAVKKRHLKSQHQWYDELCARGMEDQLRLVDGKDLPALVGSDRYLGGMINNRNGHVHPLNLCLGEAAAAAGLGVAIHEESPVSSIQHGEKAVVVTPGGQVKADFVVMAGNAYQRLEQSRLSGLVFPAGSYIIATEPLSEEEAKAINPLDLAICDQNELVNYYRMSADHRLLFGGRCNYSGRVPRDITASMMPRMLKVYPQLASKRIDYAWGGNIGVVVNRVPLVGRVEPNVFYAMGYTGHGVSVSHVCGEILADAIAGSFERMDLFSSMPHTRIPLGQSLGGQLVALGMLYYRMRDLM